jgi:DNA modification methylase
MRPYAAGRGWRLYAGDCLDIVPHIEQVDAVVTDPPYIIGAVSVGQARAKTGTWADMENSAFWFAEWFGLCRDKLAPTGYLATCCNWRSLPTLIRACSLRQMNPASCMVWDKLWIGPGAPAALRSRWEAVLFIAMPDARIDDRAAPDVYACKWLGGNMRTTDHPAEKPVQLMQHIIELTTVPDAVVLDPFAGSGTTGVAALAAGRRCILIEREPAYLDIAATRLRAAEEAHG